jgi:hypothetical protein
MGVSYIDTRKKKVPEWSSRLHPFERELPEWRSSGFCQKKNPDYD